MLAYIAKRLLAMIPTLLGITFITFLMIQLAPGDPVASSFGGGGGPSTGSEGGGDSQAKLDDAIKGKKKLLGMVVEDYRVYAWDAAAAARSQGTVTFLESGDTSIQFEELLGFEGLAELDAFIRCLVLAPDGQRVYVGTEGGDVVALDRAGGVVWSQPFDPTREVASDETSPDDGDDKSENDAAPPVRGVRAVALSPDGRRLAFASTDGVVQVRSADDGALLGATEPLNRIVSDLVAFPGDTGFASACDDGVVRFHDTNDGSITGMLERSHIGRVTALAVSKDGTRLYTGGSDRKLLEVDIASRQVLRQFPRHGQLVADIAISDDGRTLVTACHDKIVRVFDISNTEGPIAPPEELEQHRKELNAVAISPDGGTLFSGGKDEVVIAWTRQSIQGETRWAPAAVNPERLGEVYALVVAPDGRTAYSASESWRKVPIYTQYGNWLWRTVRLDFDRSFVDDRPVIDKIWERLPITMELNFIALAVIYLISIPLGVFAAVKRNSWFDNVSSVIVFILYSIPNFWAATMLIMYFSSAKYWNWFPSGGLHADDSADMPYLAWLSDSFHHLVLPIIASVYAGFASLSRYMRTSLLENISQDYVRTARAKGLSERVVIFKHALRNSLITIVTLVGNLLPAMIGGSLIIEYIFNIEGMGLLGFEAILSRDYPVIMAFTTFGAFLTLLGILISDLMYSIADPRITHG